MNTTFDAAKDALNLAKHGVSLAEAAALDWDNALVAPDRRHNYGESRQVALVPMNGPVGVVFAERPDGRRIISLRKANLREYRRYEQAP